MSCSACLICVLVILVINSKISVASCNVENQTRIDILNALLSNSGWKEVQTKYGSEFISGKDITNNNDLNIEISKNVIVNAENFTAKYIKTIQLLACVYADVMVKLIKFFTYMVLMSSRENRNVRLSLYRLQESSPKRRKRLDNKQQALTKSSTIRQTEGLENISPELDDKVSDHVYEVMKDYKKSWEILNLALNKLKSVERSFEYMFGALNYLVDLIPPCESISLKTQRIVKLYVVYCADELKNISKNIKLLLPGYEGEDDVNYNKKVGKFTKRALMLFNRLLTSSLGPFLECYCNSSKVTTLNKIQLISSYKKQIKENRLKTPIKNLPISDIIMYDLGMKIDDIAIYVINSCYSDLGFIYNENDHTTSVLSVP